MVQGVEQPAWFDASGPRCAPPNQAAILSATLKVHGYVALFVDSSRLQWGVADPTCLSPERAVVAAVVPGSFVQRLAPADVLVARQRMSQRIALAGIASARGAGLNTTPTMMTGFNNSSQRGKTEAAIGRWVGATGWRNRACSGGIGYVLHYSARATHKHCLLSVYVLLLASRPTTTLASSTARPSAAG